VPTLVSVLLSQMAEARGYGDGAGNTDEESSHAFSLIWMH